MDLSQLLPPGFLFCNQQFTDDSLVIDMIATDAVGTCPLCQTPTNRVHSFYQRTLADLPMSGKRIKLQIRLRKFLCPLADCPRKVFAQSCHSVCKPYANGYLERTSRSRPSGYRPVPSLGLAYAIPLASPLVPLQSFGSSAELHRQ